MVKSNQSSALWPYLVILLVLFVLSLAAPRSWQHQRQQVEPLTVQNEPSGPSQTILQPQQASRETPISFGPRLAPTTEKVTQQFVLPAIDSQAGLLPTIVPPNVPGESGSVIPTPTAAPATKPNSVNELTDRLAMAELKIRATRDSVIDTLQQTQQIVTTVAKPISNALRPEVLAKLLATRARTDRNNAIRLPNQLPGKTISPNQQALLDITTPRPVETANIAELSEQWPTATALIEACEKLREIPAMQTWSNQTIALLQALSNKTLSDRSSLELLTELRQVSQVAGQLAAQMDNAPEQASKVRRVQYNLVRRLDIWEIIAPRAIAQGPLSSCIIPWSQTDQRMLQAVQRAQQFLQTDPNGRNWELFLALGKMQALSTTTQQNLAERTAIERTSHGFTPSPVTANLSRLVVDRQHAASEVLARTNSPRLTAEQRTFLQQPALAEYVSLLRSWTIESRLLVDVAQVIENYETTRLPTDATTLCRVLSDLQRSSEPRDTELATALQLHYRNANVRLAVTQELLNRMIPPQESRSEQINEEIVGVPTRGQSTTFQKVKLRLIPHASAWNFSFDIAGVIDSNTASTAGPVTFVNQGESTYWAEKLVLVTPAGIHTRPTQTSAENQSQLSGLRTDYDDVPLVRNMVRNYALQQHEDSKASTQQAVSQRVAQKAALRIDQEVNERLLNMEERIEGKLLQQLRAWDLSPEVIALTTTAERAITRVRLGNTEQLGAHTARPLAWNDTLSSLQLHESTLNNFLTNLELNGKSLSIQELQQHLGNKLNRKPQTLPDDVPDNVRFTFATEDALAVMLQGERVEFTLSLAELQQGERRWRNLLVTVNYRLQADGLQLSMIRDGNVSLGGDQTGRVDVVLRGIWAKIFPREKVIPIVPERILNDQRLAGMIWSQVQIENGWLGLSLVDQKRLAQRPSAVTK